MSFSRFVCLHGELSSLPFLSLPSSSSSSYSYSSPFFLFKGIQIGFPSTDFFFFFLQSIFLRFHRSQINFFFPFFKGSNVCPDLSETIPIFQVSKFPNKLCFFDFCGTFSFLLLFRCPFSLIFYFLRKRNLIVPDFERASIFYFFYFFILVLLLLLGY